MLKVRRDDGLLLTDDRDAIDLGRVHHWLSTDTWWAAGRTLAQLRGIVEASRPYGVFSAGPVPAGPVSAGPVSADPVSAGHVSAGPVSAGHRQVAFARVVTDGLSFAYLADVYVDRSARGRGVGTWMTQQICAHLDGQAIRTVVLATTDAHDVYARAGFEDVPPRRWMWRTRPSA